MCNVSKCSYAELLKEKMEKLAWSCYLKKNVGVQDLSKQSCLYTSIVYKKIQMASILVNQLGARMTDTSFHMLYADRKSTCRRNITTIVVLCGKK